MEFPRFIQDKPKGIDLFEGGSQKSLSKAIAAHIIDNDNRNEEDALPRIIGIEGSWGSGKSNVVKLVENELNSSFSDKYYFFEYDAWGNQEDLQRRSLLEQLTCNLIENNVLIGKVDVSIKGGKTIKKTWKEKLQLLLSHKRESISETFPTINGGVVSVAIVAILTPVTSLIASILGESCPIWLRIIFALLPLVITFFIWCYKARKNPAKYYSWSYFTAIYSDKVQTVHNFETISEDEPSVVDFKAWMSDVSNNLNAKLCEKLVIVFDNMDRLPAEKVKQLWSSIHTFFAETGFENIWLVIPYDEEHLSCAFGDASAERKKLTRYFVNKTFPVTFSVSEPLITDYKGIFKKLFEEAFGTGLKNDEEIINRLYRLYHSKPNIREIIIFINCLVALYKIRKEEVSLRNMAVYQLYKDEIEKATNESSAEVILQGNYLKEATKIINNDDDFKAEIAALTYGVSKEIAKQIPLTEYLNACFEDNSSFDINRFSESDNNFDTILKEVCFNMDSAKISTAIIILNGLKKQNDVLSSIWEELADRQLKEDIVRLELPDAHCILLHHISDYKKQNIVAKLCANWIKVKDFNGRQYVKCIDLLKNEYKNDLVPYIKEKKVTPDIYVDAVSIALEDIDSYKLYAEPTEIDKYLANKLPNDFTYYKEVAALKRAKEWNFDSLLEKLGTSIKEQSLDVNNVGNICNTFRCLIPDDEYISFTNSNSNILNIISELEAQSKTNIEDGYIDLLAYTIVRGIQHNTDDKYVPEISSVIQYYSDGDSVILTGISSNLEHRNKVVKYIIENKISWNVSLQELLPNYTKIKSRYNVSEEDLLAYFELYELELPDSEIQNETVLTGLIPNVLFFNDSVRIQNKLTTAINQFAIRVLAAIKDGQSLKAGLSNYIPNDYWNKLINNLIGNNVLTELPDCVQNLVELIYKDVPIHAQNIRQSEYAMHLLNYVDVSSLTHVFVELRNSYCNGTTSINVNSFILLEKGFRIAGELDKRANESVNKILKPIITDANCKQLILSNASYYTKLVANAGNIDDFEKIIKKSLKENEVSLILSNA